MTARQPLLHDLSVVLRAPTVCLSGADGQIRADGVQGVFCGDVRVLDRAVVTVDGAEPEPIGGGPRGASSEESIGLLRGLGDPGADPTVWLRRSRTARPDGLEESFVLVNRSASDLEVELVVAVGADLAPIETVKQGLPTEPARPVVADGGPVWSTTEVTARITAPGAEITGPGAIGPGVTGPGSTGTELRWGLVVPARSETTVAWSLLVTDTGAVVAPARTGLDRTATVRADDPRLARLLDRALDDLDALLVTEPGHDDPFTAAGAPWFLTLFGRDSLWAATLLLPFDTRIAAGTLATLARVQGTRTDPATGEQPGKIAHERRRQAGRHEGGMVLPPLYYGTIDATPLWVCLLRDAWRWGMPDEHVRRLLPNLHAALGWVRDDADRDGDGFAEYLDESGHGLANQGWKDSGDSVRHASGRIADGPVALVEVQGYLYEAALAGAELLEAFDDGDPGPWREFAAALATRFRDRFWTRDADGAFPALALDGAKKPVDALTSNIGHLLGTGILDDAESDEVGRRLLGPDMASGYGLRTMSSRAGGYSPLSYHCGSVWPHDTAVVVRGLARSGQAERAVALGAGLLAAADGFDRRLPELFAGYGADEVAAPVPYPASCRPQAWSAAAVAGLVTALLGLEVDVPAGTVTLWPPRPGPLGAIEVTGLPVAGGRLDVRIDAAGDVVSATLPDGMRLTSRPTSHSTRR